MAAEGERQSILSERGLRNYRSSPLLNTVRKNEASERSSLSDSFEAPKSYGTTRNPLQPQCDIKLIGHVLESTDTLQGLAIKYGVTVEQLRRANKIWANDNIHLFKILKIPVKKESQHYVEDLEVSDESTGTDDSAVTTSDDRITNNKINSNKEKESSAVCDRSTNNSNKGPSESEEKLQVNALSFLEELDARIKNSKKESEKLRTVSGPKVIADVEKSTGSYVEEDDLFRPLETGSSRRQRGQILASKRKMKREKTAIQDDHDQFFEL